MGPIYKFKNFQTLTIILYIIISIITSAIVSSQSSNTQQQQQQPRGRPILAPKLRKETPNETAKSNPNQNPKIQNNAQTTLINSQERRSITNNNTSGRFEFVEDELPADFYEMPPEQLDLGMNATGIAPVPILNVAVLQNGQVIDSAINVHPGTPLEMVIYLDDKSAKVYGLLASYLKVKDDTFRQREEVIILNGCSIDTYIFGNFEHNPDDQSLRAKFRAFKFPDSNFIRFVGTVNVCIKQCAKVNCGGSGAGNRRKRSSGNNKQNGLVSMTVSTVLRISNPTTTITSNIL